MNTFEKSLHEKAKSIAKAFNQNQINLINILQKIEKHQIFLKLGYDSLFSYALEELKLSEANACNFITVSRKAQKIPVLQEALSSGKLSVHKARRISPVLKPNLSNQEAKEWIDKALSLPKQRLEQEVAKIYPQALTPEKYHYVHQDRLHLQFGVSEELMQRLLQIQDLLSSRQKKHTSFEEMLDIISKEFVTRHDPIEKAKRREKRLDSKKILIKTKKTFKSYVPGHGNWQDESKRESLAYWRRCQALKRDQGQCTYVHPNGQRCKRKRYLQIHHILPKSQGGGDQVDNLKTLCFNHHRLVHFHTGWKMDQKKKRLVLDQQRRQLSCFN